MGVAASGQRYAHTCTLSSTTTASQCGPGLLWELHPDTAVLRTGHVTYMMSLPDGKTFYRLILGASVQHLS